MLLLSIINEGTEICTYSSNNIFKSEYLDENLKVYFLNGTCYSYENVTSKEYYEFKLADSQGKQLHKSIKNKQFKKLDNFTIGDELEKLNVIKLESFKILLSELNDLSDNDFNDKITLEKKIKNNIQILDDIKKLL